MMKFWYWLRSVGLWCGIRRKGCIMICESGLGLLLVSSLGEADTLQISYLWPEAGNGSLIWCSLGNSQAR
jgi:hypothetical protein